MTAFTPCKELAENIADPSVPIGYASIFDEYYLARSGGESWQLISHCPFCGVRLPRSRRDQFFEEVDRLGILYELGDDLERLPTAYRSDAWWRETDSQEHR